MSEVRQWNGRTDGGNWGQKFLFFALKRVKVTALYPLLWLAIPCYLLVAHKAAAEIYRYFRQNQRSRRWQALCQTLANFYTFGEIVLDKFAMISGGKHPFEIEYEGKEIVDAAVQTDYPLMMVGAHVGNMELLGHLLKQDRKTIFILAFAGETAHIQNHRAHSFAQRNSKVIPMQNNDLSHLFAMKQAVENNDMITVFCDRMNGSTKHISVSFLGQQARFPLGSFLFAAQLQVPIVTVFVMKVKRLKYKAIIQPLTINEPQLPVRNRAEILAQQYVQHLENILRSYPLQWFNYYDFWELNTTK